MNVRGRGCERRPGKSRDIGSGGGGVRVLRAVTLLDRENASIMDVVFDAAARVIQAAFRRAAIRRRRAADVLQRRAREFLARRRALGRVASRHARTVLASSARRALLAWHAKARAREGIRMAAAAHARQAPWAHCHLSGGAFDGTDVRRREGPFVMAKAFARWRTLATFFVAWVGAAAQAA